MLWIIHAHEKRKLINFLFLYMYVQLIIYTWKVIHAFHGQYSPVSDTYTYCEHKRALRKAGSATRYDASSDLLVRGCCWRRRLTTRCRRVRRAPAVSAARSPVPTPPASRLACGKSSPWRCEDETERYARKYYNNTSGTRTNKLLNNSISVTILFCFDLLISLQAQKTRRNWFARVYNALIQCALLTREILRLPVFLPVLGTNTNDMWLLGLYKRFQLIQVSFL